MVCASLTNRFPPSHPEVSLDTNTG